MSPEPETATGLAAAIRDGKLSSEALVGACLERIEAGDDVIKAWIHLDEAEQLVLERSDGVHRKTTSLSSRAPARCVDPPVQRRPVSWSEG